VSSPTARGSELLVSSSLAGKREQVGLGNMVVFGVYADGLDVYAATLGGLGVSTDGGVNYTNRTTADGLGADHVWGAYASGSTV
jgi:hypothetical protein